MSDPPVTPSSAPPGGVRIHIGRVEVTIVSPPPRPAQRPADPPPAAAAPPVPELQHFRLRM
jgi:hypothetical protein